MQFIAMQMLCYCLALTLVRLLQKAGLAAFQPPAGFGAVLLGTLGMQGASWVLISIFLRKHQADWREAFGLRGPSLKHALFMAIATALLILPAVWLLQYLSVSMLARLGWPPEFDIYVERSYHALKAKQTRLLHNFFWRLWHRANGRKNR